MEGPHFVIDFGLWSYHTAREKKLLLKQVRLSISEIRKTCSDEQLTLSSVPEELYGDFSEMNFTGKIMRTKFQGPTAVLLDPHATEVLEKVDPTVTYILGGIVDKSRQIKTKSLWYDVPRKKIEFAKSTVGVPDRINLLIKILCESSRGIPLEKAVLVNMPRREKSERANMEASRGKDVSEIGTLLELSPQEVKALIRQ
ncbi:MAG: hypothetical protein GOV00_03015 [Candidatus Altiarchaeota archaeon]|nr:hypothetical protein [Candidatus Altiarchaeota archaeon]